MDWIKRFMRMNSGNRSSRRATTTFVYAQLADRLMPLDRGERYEDPLQEALELRGLGEVTGGGTQMAEANEIDYCGIDIELNDAAAGLPFVREFLTERGAARGSKLIVGSGEEKQELPFGTAEGVGVYLDGVGLPKEVYSTSDINVVYEKLDELIDGVGEIRGHWQGPTETALYLYGASAATMRERIADFLASYPLCQRARVVAITPETAL
jgi:hypothetical protein